MASLEELRAQLGSVDDKIVELYEERMKLCEEIGICKIENGYKTFDRQREKNTITDVMNKVSSDINKKGIGEVYEQLLAISRKLQYKQLVEAGALGRLPFIGIDLLDKDTARVVFQGTEGAYSQAAMEHYFNWEVISEKTVIIIMYIRSGKQWKQSKKVQPTMRCFRLKIRQQVQSMRFMICW